MIINILYDVLFGVPVTLGKKVIEGLRGEIDKERLITEASIKERLQQLQLLLQDDEISEIEYEKMETELIERLRAVKEYQRSIK